MKPALSVLIFTVSSGAGYGLFMWMFACHLIMGTNVDLRELIITGFIGLVLVTLGLLSSTLHLANPKNAWRAFNRFRTSWLSREGVFAVLFYPLVLGYALLVWLSQGQLTVFAQLLAAVSLLIALVTVICTGMIYASLKPIRQWHNPLTTPLYVLFSLMSGGLLFTLVYSAFHGAALSSTFLIGFLVMCAVAAVTKFAYFISIGKPDGATISSATGLATNSQAQVRLLDAGHNAETFLTKEFVYDTNALKLVQLRRLMALFAFALPSVLAVVSFYTHQSAWLYLAMVSVFGGLLLERWLFFAEARHVVRLYHGDQRT